MGSLWRSSSLFAGTTVISRLFGLVRDCLIAALFGASAGTDAFWVAFKIPNFLRRLFAEGSFSQAFIPTLTDYRCHASKETLQHFICSVSGVLGGSLLVITLIAVIFSPELVHAFAPGFGVDELRYSLAVSLLRITFPYIVFIALTAFVAAILNSYGRFGWAAFSPVWLNLSLIVGALWGASRFGIQALAWSVLIAGVIQLVALLPALHRLNLLHWPRFHWHHPGVKQVLLLMGPTLIGSSVSQINLLIDNLLASWLQVGSISWLYYADRLSQFPLGVFGVAIGTVLLPRLSQQHVEHDPSAFSGSMHWGIRFIVLLGTPASIGLALLAKPLFITLLHYGNFTEHDVTMSSHALIALAFGLTPFMLIKVLTAAFYATKNTKTPMRIALFVMAFNTGLSLLLLKSMAHVGLALATSIAAWLNVSLLLIALKRVGIYQLDAGLGVFLFRILVANVVLGSFLMICQPPLIFWLQWPVWPRIYHLFFIIFLGATSYLATLWLLRFNWQEILRS